MRRTIARAEPGPTLFTDRGSAGDTVRGRPAWWDVRDLGDEPFDGDAAHPVMSAGVRTASTASEARSRGPPAGGVSPTSAVSR